MRIALALVVATGTARADIVIDTSVRGAASVEVGREVRDRGGLVPALAMRFVHDSGGLQLGAGFAAMIPAWYGEEEAFLTAGYGRVVSHTANGPRVALAGAVDAGVAMLFIDAPPGMETTGDAAIYDGPRARLRGQLTIAWPTPNGKYVGVTVGGGVAATRAHYDGGGIGTRVEPSLELGLHVRL